MFLRTHTPGPPLDEYVDRFWLCSDTPQHPRERILPSGTVELVINLSDDEIRIYDSSHPDRCRRYSGAVVSGPYRSFIVIDPLQHASIIGVHFRPGRAVPVLGLPASEVTDAHVDLETLWGPTAAELRERLCAAATPAERFAVLEDVLLGRLCRARPRHGAIPVALDALERADAVVTVRDLARRVGLSQRRFIQLFTAEVGLTPKLYGRVRRFQRARELVRMATEPDWAAVAVACGFFDQSHLIRDFGEFSGLSPVAYMNQRSKHVLLNHVPWVG
ncbi:AraC family transcriptional regulator [bacterium]|nr:AraC family transcriptional regulator [bacterium]